MSAKEVTEWQYHTTVAVCPVAQTVVASGLMICGTKTSCTPFATSFIGEALAMKKKQKRVKRKEANVRAIVGGLWRT